MVLRVRSEKPENKKVLFYICFAYNSKKCEDTDMKKALSFFVIVFILFSLNSCNREISCEELLSKLLSVSGEDTYGNGLIFCKKVCEGEVGYISVEQKEIMYGEDAENDCFSKTEDFAIFVSQRIPGELAVFKCYSRSDTDIIAQMCLRRAESIRVALRDSEYEEKTESIQVSVYHRFVVFSFTDAPRRVENKFKSLV